jgi:hypothetical protein
MTSNYTEQSDKQLFSVLKTLSSDIEKNIVEMAHVLVELRRRGFTHEYTRSGILRWHRELAAGTLTPKAVITFGGVGTVLRKMTGLLPPEMQDRLAAGEKLDVATYDSEGKIVTEKRTILQLTTRQLDLVFGDKGAIRPIAAQRRILAKRKPEGDVRRSKVALNIRADVETGDLVCGQLRINISEPGFIAALGELGFTIIRKGRAAA